MQNYEKGFVKRAADAIYQEMEERWRQREIAKIYMVEEQDEKSKTKKTSSITEEEKKLMKTHSKQNLQV